MRLLVIEDNIELSNSMKKGLENMNFKVDISNTGEEGEDKASINEYDVILLDLNLPDTDGIEVLKYLRKKSIDTPIIIITARDNVSDLAIGLDNGADDYITKPFQLLEVRARIHAVIRRFHGRTNPIINIGTLKLNPVNRTVYIDDK
ncbi:response regulator [[Clostridium] bifermentans ATCC 19299]|nr:response regulator transcription factor [Paraclostridium bifermentans]EQK44995.1 response regulator [[Clostridium] bifermentans ATCC 19299] [Paraclostridium bifermentans ATCC 19299]